MVIFYFTYERFQTFTLCNCPVRCARSAARPQQLAAVALEYAMAFALRCAQLWWPKYRVIGPPSTPLVSWC
jgi:hypothetical protein